jgi:hypothetical protein
MAKMDRCLSIRLPRSHTFLHTVYVFMHLLSLGDLIGLPHSTRKMFDILLKYESNSTRSKTADLDSFDSNLARSKTAKLDSFDSLASY